jgi:hypothetical protein
MFMNMNIEKDFPGAAGIDCRSRAAADLTGAGRIRAS